MLVEILLDRNYICLYCVCAHLLLSMHCYNSINRNVGKCRTIDHNSVRTVGREQTLCCVRGNGVKLNADCIQVSKCITPVCGDSTPRSERFLFCVCAHLLLSININYCNKTCSSNSTTVICAVHIRHVDRV